VAVSDLAHVRNAFYRSVSPWETAVRTWLLRSGLGMLHDIWRWRSRSYDALNARSLHPGPWHVRP